MPEYTVLSGTHRREDGSVAEEGDVVEMTEEHRDSFSPEKFRLAEDEEESGSESQTVGGETASAESEATEAEPDELPNEPIDEEDLDEWDEEEAEPSADIPEEWETLRSMAMAYDGSEITGSTSKDDIVSFLETLDAEEVSALREEAEGEE